MPTPARGPDDVARGRRRRAVVGVDVSGALEHDEELVGVAVEVPVVAGARRQLRPSEQEVVRAGVHLVDEELDPHVDPALVLAQAPDERDVGEVEVEALGHEPPPSMR